MREVWFRPHEWLVALRQTFSAGDPRQRAYHTQAVVLAMKPQHLNRVLQLAIEPERVPRLW